MKKILFIGNIAGKKMTGSFSGAAIRAAHELGLDFHSVANRTNSTKEQILLDQAKFGIKMHHADINRSPFSKSNIKAFRQIVDIINEQGIDFIHCNTPVGGLLGRLAGKKCGVKRVIYQAHGFHFYKGAPKKNWLLYYPVEKWLAHYTDALIAINNEDYVLAKNKLKLRNKGKVYYVPGVGIDPSQYNSVNVFRDEKRKELGIPLDAFVLISAGELNQNKNNTVIISAMEKLKRNDIHYVLCGVGPLEGTLREQAVKAGLERNVHFLGYRTDIKELYQMADCFVMPSYREGLSRSIMEAMASGLPCIVSKIRGNVDMVDHEKLLCEPNDAEAFSDAMLALCEDHQLITSIAVHNTKRVEKFSIDKVESEIKNIYQEQFENC